MGAKRYTKADRDFLVKSLEGGATFKAACAATGCSPTGMREYMKRNPGFAVRVNRARGRARDKVENSLFLAATMPDDKGRYNERAQQYWLNNQYPEDWKAKRDDVMSESDEAAEHLANGVAEQLSPEVREELRKLATQEILKGASVH